MPIDLRSVLRDLAAERPLFHSEADFQHALAWLIHEQHPTARVRLEVPAVIAGRRVHVDVWVTDADERLAIELKYFTLAVDAVVHGERFQLKNQGAQDLGRYDVLKDLTRVEVLVGDGVADRGLVILVTDDATYWGEPHPRSSPNYAAFRLGDGRALGGTLAWGPNTGAGTMAGREASLALAGSYVARWTDYADLTSVIPRGGVFRYLLLEVGGTPSA